MLRGVVLLAGVALSGAFLFPAPRLSTGGSVAKGDLGGCRTILTDGIGLGVCAKGAQVPVGTRLGVAVSEEVRELVPVPVASHAPSQEKLFVFLWIDHLGNRIYKATKMIGASPRRIKLWNPEAPEVSAQEDPPTQGLIVPVCPPRVEATRGRLPTDGVGILARIDRRTSSRTPRWASGTRRRSGRPSTSRRRTWRAGWRARATAWRRSCPSRPSCTR
jgi:hypothetical protein